MTEREHDPLWDASSGAPDEGLARLEAALRPLGHRAPLRDLPPRRRARTPWIATGAVVLAAAAALLIWWTRRPDEAPPGEVAGFRYESTTGEKGVLPVGGVLEPGQGETVRVEVADIGTIDLAGGSQLSLVETGPEQHRLDLRHGKLHASVTAPPRLFVIDTPSADVIDLGCAYDLEVDPDGAGFLRVTSGSVELATGEILQVVPMGASARIWPGRGPGTPAMDTSSPELRAAIDRFDGGDVDAIDDVVRHAAKTDTLTLWNALWRRSLDADARGRLFDAIAAAIPLPPWIERERVAAGEREKFEQLREAIEAYWWYPEALDRR